MAVGMKVVLVADCGEQKTDDIPMEIKGFGTEAGVIVFTVKGKEYAVNLKDFDDSKKFLEDKCKAQAPKF